MQSVGAKARLNHIRIRARARAARSGRCGPRLRGTGITVHGSDFGHYEPVWRHPVLKLLIVAYIAWGGWNWFIDRPVHPRDGILAPDEPQQGDLPSAGTYHIGRWTLTPRATYQVTARILHVERYRFDFLAPLIPEDLALGWGPMSDGSILNGMEISQSNRFYFWRSPMNLPVPKDAIISHSANTHVIAENSLIASQLSHLRRGQVVSLSGVLVDGKRDDGASIKTSLVRTDSGGGACEILLVHGVSVVPEP